MLLSTERTTHEKDFHSHASLVARLPVWLYDQVDGPMPGVWLSRWEGRYCQRE